MMRRPMCFLAVLLLVGTGSANPAPTMADIDGLLAEGNALLGDESMDKREAHAAAIDAFRRALDLLDRVEGISNEIRERKRSDLCALVYWTRKFMPLSRTEPSPPAIPSSDAEARSAYDEAEGFARDHAEAPGDVALRYAAVAGLYPDHPLARQAEEQARGWRDRADRAAREAAPPIEDREARIGRLDLEGLLSAYAEILPGSDLPPALEPVAREREEVLALKRLRELVVGNASGIPCREVGLPWSGEITGADAEGLSVPGGTLPWEHVGPKLLGRCAARLLPRFPERAADVAITGAVANDPVVARPALDLLLRTDPERLGEMKDYFGRVLADAGAASGAAMIPFPDARAARERLVRSIFREEYASRDGQVKADLAARLLTLGEETDDDASGRYVLFRESLRLASEAREIDAARAAAEALGRDFLLDGVALRLEGLSGAARGRRSSDDATFLAGAYLALARDAMHADSFGVASNAAREAISYAGRARDRDLQEAARNLRNDLARIESAYEGLRPSQLRLHLDPADETANTAIGRYACLLKGDWQTGLPLLERGLQNELARQAARDLTDPLTADGQAAVGDGWWEMGEASGDDLIRKNCRRRAGFWYRQAVGSLTGLTRAQVEKRLEQIPPEPGGTPTRFPQAFAFQGSGSRLAPDDPGPLVRSFGKRTVEAWILPAGTDGIVYEEGAGGNGFAIGVYGTEIRFATRAGGRQHTIQAAITNRDWMHVAVQYDDGEMTLWIDGKLAAEETAPWQTVPDHPDPPAIGGCNGGNSGGWANESFAGRIAVIRISDTARYDRPFRPETSIRADGDTLYFLNAKERDVGEVTDLPDGANGSTTWQTPPGQVEIVRD